MSTVVTETAGPGAGVLPAIDDSPVRFRRAAVLGTGLIGGSMAAALRARGLCQQIVGFSPGPDAAEALALGLIDHVGDDARDAVAGADLVIIAAPIPAIPALFDAIAGHLSPQALVIDCASTKRSVIAAADARAASFRRFVASHPIAGGERHGPGAARADLFAQRIAVVCPRAAADPGAEAQALALWRALGAQTVTMSAAEHDALFAEVSHWPHALAFALCGAIAGGPRAQAASLHAGAGLRDTTRIGASSGPLWADILLDNRDTVLDCAEAFLAELSAVLGALRAGDRATLARHFEAAAAWRRGMPPACR